MPNRAAIGTFTALTGAYPSQLSSDGGDGETAYSTSYFFLNNDTGLIKYFSIIVRFFIGSDKLNVNSFFFGPGAAILNLPERRLAVVDQDLLSIFSE